MINDFPDNKNELLTSIGEGDEAAFTEFYLQHRKRIYTVAFKLTHSNSVAEEIVQDVFLKLWLKRADLRDIQYLNSYVYIVTRNEVYRVLNQIARNYKTVLLTEDDQSLATNDSSDPLMEKEYHLLLQKAINQLPSQQQQVYRLMKDQGLKREEVAKLLEVQPGTVKFHLAQAMKNVRNFCILHLGLFIGFMIFLFCVIQGIIK